MKTCESGQIEAVILVPNKTNTPVAYDVLLQNGFTVSEPLKFYDSNWVKNGVFYKFAHSVWAGNKVRMQIISN